MEKQTQIDKPRKPESNRNNHTTHLNQDFISWCKEFKVGILSNKDATIEVVVGNHIKRIKLDQPF